MLSSGNGLFQGLRDVAGADVIPACGSRESTWGRVHRDEMFKVVGGESEFRAGPVLPEMLQIGPDSIDVSVQKSRGQPRAVKALVPEFGGDGGVQDPWAGAREGRRKDECSDEVGPV